MPENFKNHGDTTLSDLLAQKRLVLDLTLEEVQKKTGVKSDFIKALEQGKFNELPASVYVQGYLKSLSKLYGLELAKLLEAYKEEQDLRLPILRYDDLKQTQINEQFLQLTPKNLATVSLLAVFLIVFGYMFSQIRSLRAAPDLRLDQPSENFQTTTDTIEIMGKTEPGSVVTINNQVIQLDSDGHFRLNLHMSLGENELVVRSLNRFDRYTEIKRRIVVGSTPLTPEVLGEKTPE